MYKVILMGASFDTGNQGVSALAASLMGIIGSIRPESEFSFFIGSKRSEKREVEIFGRRWEYQILHYRLSPKARFREHLFSIFAASILQRLIPFPFLKDRIVRFFPVLQAFEEADFVGDIRGGDSFSDIYGLRRAVMGSIPSIIAILMGKRLVLLPQTYGPYRTWAARLIARWILKRAAAILARDEEGIGIVKGMLGSALNGKVLRFCPDVAFTLEAKVPQHLSFSPPPPTDRSGKEFIGLNLNGLLFNGGYTRNNMFGLSFDYREFAERLAANLLERTSAHLVLIPHTFAPPGHVESDPEACRAVFSALKERFAGRIHLLEGNYDPSEMKGIIGFFDFFIGSRMHACIAALSQGIPTVGVAYSRKFKGVFGSVGMEETAIDARSLTLEEAISKTMEIHRRREEVRRILRGKVLEAKFELNGIFLSLMNPNKIDPCPLRPTFS